MGDYRITIDAVGGHGCQREIKDSEMLQKDCGSSSCPDCAARRLVAELKAHGDIIMSAKLEHWPAVMMKYDGTVGDRGGSNPGPIDDLITDVRHGSF